MRSDAVVRGDRKPAQPIVPRAANVLSFGRFRGNEIFSSKGDLDNSGAEEKLSGTMEVLC
jgi:hypothetical protein